MKDENQHQMCVEMREADFQDISELEWEAFSSCRNTVSEVEGAGTSDPKISNFDSCVDGAAISQRSEYGCINNLCAGR